MTSDPSRPRTLPSIFTRPPGALPETPLDRPVIPLTPTVDRTDGLGLQPPSAAPEAPLAGPLLLSVPEAVALLSVSRTQIYALLKSGDLVGVKVGRRRLIRRSDLVAYVERLSP